MSSIHPFFILFTISLSLVCSLEVSSNRILNGRVALKQEFPYQVSIQKLVKGEKYPRKFCGGAIIGNKWILTAAHCYDSISPGDEIYINSGVVNAYNYGPPSQLSKVQKAFLHPNYTTQGFDNDIAVLELSSELSFNRFVASILLPPVTFNVKDSGTVMGWGRINETEEISSEFLQVADNIPVSDSEECRQTFPDSYNPVSELCVGANVNQNSCVGDSGGPFIQISNGVPMVVGVVSFGKATCDERPAIYTNVIYFRSFVDDVLTGKIKQDGFFSKLLQKANSRLHSMLKS